MTLMERIVQHADSLIETHPPATASELREAQERLGVPIPQALGELLRVSNGIGELAQVNGEHLRIGYLVYTLEEMVKWSTFYQSTYERAGIVFADNGAGDPYFLMDDGSVQAFDPITQESETVAKSLDVFFAHEEHV